MMHPTLYARRREKQINTFARRFIEAFSVVGAFISALAMVVVVWSASGVTPWRWTVDLWQWFAIGVLANLVLWIAFALGLASYYITSDPKNHHG